MGKEAEAIEVQASRQGDALKGRCVARSVEEESLKDSQDNCKKAVEQAVGGLTSGATAPYEPSFEDRKARLLRRFDWAEGEFLRQIVRLREAREALQHANHNTVQVMEILLSLDTDLRKY